MLSSKLGESVKPIINKRYTIITTLISQQLFFLTETLYGKNYI